MADGAERGGLEYVINVTGNFEEKFARFEALLKKLETQAKVSGKTTATKATTAGAESAKTEEKAQQKIIGTLNKKSAVEKKILQLRNRQQVAVSKQVTNEKVLTDTVERRQKADVAIQKTQLKTVKQSITLSKAEERIANVALKRLEIEKAIQLARKQGAITSAQISQTTGLSQKQITDNDKAAAKQIQVSKAKQKALKDERREREGILKQQAREVVQAKKIADRQAKQLSTQRKIARETAKTATNVKKVAASVGQAESLAQRFLFTFRRLVGILAIFTLARKFAQLIGNAVKEMTRFNSVLEQTKIGFASLIASAGEMVDANGQLVTGAEEYIQALVVAETVQTKIRKSALGTIATYEDLLAAFQSGIGPGLAAGLDLDQIEAVTIALVKAASTLGVEGAQFTEEVRSIIQGTGALRTTRLLQIPGLSKENIRLAKEQGRLFDQIISTLEPFNKATEDITKSWAGLQSQIKDAVSSLLASGSVEYFDSLRASMEGFVNSLIARDKVLTDNFGLNEDAVAAVEEVSSALQAVIKNFGTLVSFDELFGSLRLNFAAIGEVLKLISAFLTPVIVGFGRGVTLVAAMLAGIIKIGRFITRIVPKAVVKGFKEILAFVSSIVGIILTWVVLTKIYNGLLIATKTIIASIGILQTAYLLILEIISVVQKARIAQESILLAITTAIGAVVNITALVIGAIVITIGIILVKTGALSKIFGKINKSLDDSESTLGRIKDSIIGGTNAIFSQGQETKKLEASFKSLEDRLIKMQNATKSLLLTSAIRGEAKQVFTAITSGLEKFANDSINIRREIEQNEADIFRKKQDRDIKQRAFDKARIKNLKKDQEEVRSLLSGPGALRRPTQLIGTDAGTPVVQILGREAGEALQELNKSHATLNAAILTGNKLQEVRQQLLQKNIDLIEEKVRQETISLNIELSGNKTINDQFELRKALVLEEVRNAKAAVKAFQLQSVELQRQIALKENNDALDDKSIAAINETIRLAKEANADAEAILKLEQARDSTVLKNLLRREREATIIRTMKKDLEDMAKIVVTNDWLVAMSDGFEAGVKQFIESAEPLAQGFADAMQSALEDAVNAASEAITDIIDPRAEAGDPQEIAGEVLLSLAEELINVILSEFLQNMLTTFLGLETTEQIQIEATLANTLALETLTLALGADTTATTADTVATTADAAATAADATATTVNTAATTVNTGSILGNTIATITNTVQGIAAFIANTAATIFNTIALWVNTAVPGQHGGLVTARGGFARNLSGGGWINPLNIVPTYTHAQGFASGGDVKRHPRPSYISPTDTVAAWLAPEEFVMQKSIVQRFGARFFDMINRGIITPAMLNTGGITPAMGRQHLTANIARSQRVYGLAHGGSVGRASPSVAASRATEGGGQGTIVLPVIAADDNTMDQMIAGGIDVFEQGVNDTPAFGNQNESNS